MIAVKHEDRGPGRTYRGWHKGRILSGASIAPKRLHKINLEAGIEPGSLRLAHRPSNTVNTVWMVRLNT